MATTHKSYMTLQLRFVTYSISSQGPRKEERNDFFFTFSGWKWQQSCWNEPKKLIPT